MTVFIAAAGCFCPSTTPQPATVSDAAATTVATSNFIVCNPFLLSSCPTYATGIDSALSGVITLCGSRTAVHYANAYTTFIRRARAHLV
jgi:hypothetical protein